VLHRRTSSERRRGRRCESVPSVPCRPGTSAYRLNSKTRSKTHCHMHYSSGSRLPAREGSSAATCPATPDPASLLGRVPVLPRAPRLRTPPPCSGGLRCSHVPRSSGPCLPAREGSGVATCPAAPDPSLLRRAPALPRAPRLRIPRPCLGGLRRCHMSRSSGACLPDREGSGAAMCPAAPDPASLLGRDLALPRAPQLWTPRPYSVGLQRCHVSRNSRPCLPAREGSDAATCPMAPDPAFLFGRAPTQPRVPWLSAGDGPQE
jgi:hypothetical protein